MSRVVGLDLSLTATGVSDGLSFADVIKTKTPKTRTEQHLRLAEIRQQVVKSLHLASGDIDLVVIEGPSYGSVGGSSHERAGLWWIIADSLWGVGIPYAVVSPSGLKKYATGTGVGSKEAVLSAVIRRWPDFAGSDNNAADAWVLACMGREHLGLEVEHLPAVNRAALDKVTWP